MPKQHAVMRIAQLNPQLKNLQLKTANVFPCVATPRRYKLLTKFKSVFQKNNIGVGIYRLT